MRMNAQANQAQRYITGQRVNAVRPGQPSEGSARPARPPTEADGALAATGSRHR